jgi:hypothetical protein
MLPSWRRCRKMAKEICEDCGRVFEAGPYSFFCPECRKRRISKASSERAKRIGLSRMGVEARWGKKKEAQKDGSTTD